MGLLLTVRVLLRNDEYVKSLEQDIADANERAEYWKNRYKKLEFDYAKVSHVNLEMIDTLKAHGIRYRPGLDCGTWVEE